VSRIPAELVEKFNQISSRNFSGQAKWMLNGFWQELEPEAEKIWGFVELFVKLEETNKAEGSSLDEFSSHRFLESLGETMTIIKLRETLRTIDLDNDKRMSLIEYLMYRYKKSPAEVCNAPQGENKEGIARAQAMVAEAQAAVEECVAKYEKAKEIESAAAAAEAEAKAKAAEAAAKAAEADEKARIAEAAEAEQQAALQVLNNEEKAYNDQIAALTAKTQTGSSFQRSLAANELAQLKSKDPLPLQKAKITQTAAVKKAEKAANILREAQAAAQAAADAAAQAAQAAEAKRVEATNAANELEQAVQEANAKLQEANDFLEEEKKKGGIAQGDIWWMQRELEEKKKYMPKAKAALL